MSEFCHYCDKLIYTDECGWGYYLEDYIKVLWHSECFQINEGVPVS